MSAIDFEQWIVARKDEILQAQTFTKSDLPSCPSEIHADLNRAIREYPRMAELLAEVEEHLIKARAMETLDIRCDPKFADWTGPERKTIADSRLAHIIKVRDVLRATCRALEERNFALLNQRRYEEASLRVLHNAE